MLSQIQRSLSAKKLGKRVNPAYAAVSVSEGTMLQVGLRTASVAPPARQHARGANTSAARNSFRRGHTPLQRVTMTPGRRTGRMVVSAELSDKGRRFRAADVEVSLGSETRHANMHRRDWATAG